MIQKGVLSICIVTCILPVFRYQFTRMAVAVNSVRINDVGKPNLGEVIPSHVHGSLDLDISRFSGAIADEWLGLKDHDVVFLVCIEKPSPEAGGKQLEQYQNERTLLSQVKCFDEVNYIALISP